MSALIEQATVDGYKEAEQMTGFFTMIEDNVAIPFATKVLGVEVTVEAVDPTEDEQMGRCLFPGSVPAASADPGPAVAGSGAGRRGVDRGVPGMVDRVLVVTGKPHRLPPQVQVWVDARRRYRLSHEQLATP